MCWIRDADPIILIIIRTGDLQAEALRREAAAHRMHGVVDNRFVSVQNQIREDICNGKETEYAEAFAGKFLFIR